MKYLAFLLTLIYSVCFYTNRAEAQTFFSIEEGLKAPETVIFLDLSDKGLTSIPNEILQFTNLEVLNLNFNQFEEFPAIIFQIKTLKELQIQGTQNYIEKYEREKLPETVPESISELVNLEILNLSYNELNSLPRGLGDLKMLRELNIFHNSVNKQEDLTTISKLSELTRLDIGGNDITGLPSSLKNLKNLRVLHLENSYSEGVPVGDRLEKLPACVCKLKKLEALNLIGQNISTLPGKISGLTSLINLDLYDNPILSFPEEIGKLDNLESIDVGYYCIGMTDICEKPIIIPESMCKLKKLKRLNIYGRTIDREGRKRLEECSSVIINED